VEYLALEPRSQVMIEAKNLVKIFFVAKRFNGSFGAVKALFNREAREVRAVDDISFKIAPGDFVGYVGPNGAGKSTTIKMLAGILHPSDGEILIGGVSPQRHRRQVAKNLGVVFGQRTQLWWDLPVVESYELLAAMYGVDRERYLAAMKRFDELLGIGELLDVPVRKLSLGQRMRADIAAALLHDPPVLFLDEPTIGLDVVAKDHIRSFLREVNARGTTVLLTTHDLSDIEELCRRVMVVNHGKLVFDGCLDALRAEIGVPTQLTVDYTQPPANGETLSGLGFQVVDGDRARGPNSLTVAFDRALISASDAIKALGELGEIKDVHLTEPAIEQMLKQLY